MKLSIGMIVKNEEAHLRSCLDSLRPILEQVDSELIIADTGSSDSSKKIAEEYTDKVFDVEWCNDFSAARNATVERAKGEWFMSVDGDEVFEDAALLINFFNSGEYKKYNSATFIQRNFKDQGRKVSSDFNAPRLTKLKKETRYVREIHEYLNTFGEPLIILPVVANHYGYILNKNSETSRKKALRNIELLERRIQKNPECIDMMYLSQSYSFYGDRDAALKYCDQGLEIARRNDNPLQYTLYALKAGYLHTAKNYGMAWGVTEEFFKNKSTAIATDLEMYYIQADCKKMLGNDRGAENDFICYLKFFRDFKSGKYQTIDSLHHSICFSNETARTRAVDSLIEVLEEQYDGEKFASRILEIEELSDAHEMASKINDMCASNNFTELKEYYHTSGQKAQQYIRIILERALNSPKYREGILNAFSKTDGNQTEYEGLMYLRCAYERNTLDNEKVIEFFNHLPEWNALYSDAFYIAVALSAPVKDICNKIPKHDLLESLLHSRYLHYTDLQDKVCWFSESALSSFFEYDPTVQLWLSELFRCSLANGKLEKNQVFSVFAAYAETLFAYLTRVCREEFLTDEKAYLLMEPYQAGYFSYRAVQSWKQGNQKLASKYLKDALKADNQLDEAIRVLLEKLKQAEMELLAKSVKEKIHFLIERGEKKLALQVIQSFVQLCPDDSEISELRNKIALM